MKLREVFTYELAHRLRSGSTWLYAGLFLVVGFMVVNGSRNSGSAVLANAPIQLATFMIGFSIFGLVVSSALFGDAAVRDVQAGMDPLLFTAPFSKTEYLLGRFAAAFVINLVVLFAGPLGMAAATLVPGVPAGGLGPFRPEAYLQPWLLFLVPNVIIIGAVLFATGVLTRSVIPVYLAAIGIFAGGIIAANLVDGTESTLLWIVGNPFGVSALSEYQSAWTIAEKNGRLIGYPTDLVWNRAFWMAFAIGVSVLLHRRFSFAHATGGRDTRRAVEVEAAATHHAPAAAVPHAERAFSTRTTLYQMLSTARNALSEMAAGRAFAAVLLACVVLTVLWGWNVASTVFETETWPVTVLIAEVAVGTRFGPVVYLLLALYAGELVWKDREVGVAEITDAAPVTGTVALTGRFLALCAMLVMVHGAATLGGVMIQALQGYYNFEPGVYAGIVFGAGLSTNILLAALAMVIHVVVNHKYVGHLFVVGAIILTKVAGPVLGIRHNLLVYARDPGWVYSDMNGFGPFLGPLVWFRLYWAAWALLLGILAMSLWVRGREAGWRRRLRQSAARFTLPVIRTASATTALIVILGGFIFYNTNILNRYIPTGEAGAEQAEYEKRYARFTDAAQPTIVSASLRVEIHHDEQAADMRGSYRLVNRTTEPIDSVHVVLDSKVDARSIVADRSATAVVTDTEVGYHILELSEPLQPGESMLLTFDVAYRQRGFPNGDIPTDITEDGALFNRTMLPFIGYQPFFELRGAAAREVHGLGPQPRLQHPDSASGRQHRDPWRDADGVQVDMIIGTDAGKVAITPGVLRRAWSEEGRRYFHYSTDAPESFGATVMAGRYTRVADRWNDVALSIYHHPDHAYNLPSFMNGMKASLQYLSTEFGAYPYDRLRIVEVPRYDSYGRAHPMTVEFTENYFIIRPKDGTFDQVFYATAHEIAHTWWGGRVRGGMNVLGHPLLTEALANYSAMMVTEATFGLEEARRVYDFQMERYLAQRARMGRDVPLLEVENQPWIFYGKGAVAMYLLRDYIGAAPVNRALRRMQDRYGSGRPPYPTSRDLVAALKTETPDSLHYLLSDLFETVTLWDVRTRTASVQRTATGELEVTLNIVAKKVRADREGNESEVPMNDVVEIGVFGEDEAADPLYLQRHRIRSGEQTIRVRVKGEPARAGVDPYRKLIDRNRDDNMVLNFR